MKIQKRFYQNKTFIFEEQKDYESYFLEAYNLRIGIYSKSPVGLLFCNAAVKGDTNELIKTVTKKNEMLVNLENVLNVITEKKACNLLFEYQFRQTSDIFLHIYEDLKRHLRKIYPEAKACLNLIRRLKNIQKNELIGLTKNVSGKRRRGKLAQHGTNYLIYNLTYLLKRKQAIKKKNINVSYKHCTQWRDIVLLFEYYEKYHGDKFKFLKDIIKIAKNEGRDLATGSKGAKHNFLKNRVKDFKRSDVSQFVELYLKNPKDGSSHDIIAKWIQDYMNHSYNENSIARITAHRKTLMKK